VGQPRSGSDMSFHLPGPTKGKIEHLIATYGAERISKPPKALRDIPESKALICVVDSVRYETATYCFSTVEMTLLDDSTGRDEIVCHVDDVGDRLDGGESISVPRSSRAGAPRRLRRPPESSGLPRVPARGRGRRDPTVDGGPRVRILLPPARSLCHRCLRWLPAQRSGFRRECEPGRDQRTGRAGHEPARLGPFSLTGIDAVPLGKSRRSTRTGQVLALDTRCRGSLFSAQIGCADRSSRAADRVR
jgi:hypothetical protein